MKRINDRFYVLEYEEFSDRPNLYYIKGDDYSVIVDAGNSRKHVEKMYSELNELGLPLPKYTIISHWHWDHTFGLNAIVGKSVSTKKTHDILLDVSKWKWTLEDMKYRLDNHIDIEFCDVNIKREYQNLNDIKVISTNEYIEENKVLDLGGIKLELIPMESTHGDDSLFVYIPKFKALIVEDADCPNYYISDEYNDLDKLKKMIDFFESIDYDYHYLGHAEVETKQYAINRLKAEL